MAEVPQGQYRGDSRIKSISLPGWDGGLNTEADEFQLEPNESPDCLNVEFGLRGAVSKRDGYTQFSSVDTFGCANLRYWKKSGGAQFMINVSSDGDIEYADVDATAVFSTEATSWGAPSSMEEWWSGIASLDNVLYVSRVDGNTWSFDGTTWTEITDYTLSGGGSEFPRAAHLLSLHERIFAANIDNGGTRYRSRIQFSNAGAAGVWDTDDWIDVSPDDGQQITAMVAYGESIIIFKESSVYVLSGTDPTSFTLYPLDAEVGTTAPASVHPAANLLLFFDPKAGAYSFDGADFKKIDDKILTHVLDGMNYDAGYKAAGWVYRDRYYLSVPWGSATDNSRTFVYDTRNKAWTQWSYGVNAFVLFESELYGGEANGTGGIYKLMSGITDDGATISSYVETAWLSPENEAVRGRLRRVDWAFTALGNIDITVELYRDFGTDVYKSQTINTSPGGGVWGTMVWGTDSWGLGFDQVFRRTVGWGQRWRVIKFRIIDANASGGFQLNRLNIHHSSLGRVRGTP